MFYYIKGKLVFTEASQAVIDVGGVAYALTVSSNTQSAVASLAFNSEADVTLYTHLSVREDGLELFGFRDIDELNMFKKLITVSGVGPKAAMSLLSYLNPDDISAAIFSDNKKAISKAPGIGPKTAARIILELKDKVSHPSDTLVSSEASADNITQRGSKFHEALDALTVLGFHRSIAEEALKTIDITNSELEDIIREALKKLMK